MTITVKHKFVSAIPDEADATVVRPSNWNDTHDIVGLGTSASLDAGVANGVATLDSSGTVPTSQLPSLSGSYVPYTGATGAVDLNAKTLVNIANLGVNTTTVPTIKIRAVGDNNSTSRIAMRGYSSDANSSSIRVSKFRGSVAAPQAPLSGDSLGKFELAGYGTTSADAYPQSSLEGVATENWGATARGAKAVVKVTPNTTTTQVTALTIDQDSKATFANTVTANGTLLTGNTGTVTSVGGTGTVNGINLSGTVTSSGNLTLGGTLDLSSPPAIGSTTPSTGAFTTLKANSELVNQSYDQGTGVLQVTGASSFNGAVVDKSLNLQGGNNLILQSTNFSVSPWTTSNVAVTPNQSGSWDGTSTANLILPNTTNGTHYILQTNVAVTSNSTPVSIYAKANGYQYLQLFLGANTNQYANFDLINGVIGSFGSAVIGTPTISNVGNGWYRCVCIMTTSSVAISAFVGVIPASTSAWNTSWTPNGTSSIYANDLQMENGSVASAYTPTTTAAVTTTNNLSIPSGTATSNSYSINGGTGFYGSSAGSEVGSAGSYSFSSTTASNGTPDTYLYRDAANTLAQRNSTNAQAFRLYNTYTSSSVGEWLSVDWTTTANTATIATKANGAGVVRTLATGNPLVISTGYTVANLPTGVVGMRAYVTNALAPTYATTVVGGGAVTIPVFYNGTNWICA